MSKANNLTKIVFVALLVTFFFLIIIGLQAMNINNNKTCGNTKIVNTRGNLDVDYYVFTNQNSFLTKTLPVNNNFVSYDFCVRYNATNDLRVTVVNEENLSLAKLYLPTGKNTICTGLINYSDYIGLTCDNCNQTTNMTIFESVGSNIDSEFLITDFEQDISIVHNNDVISYNFYTNDSCKETVKQFMFYYLTIIGVLLLLFLIILGSNEFKKNLLDVWGDDF